MPSYNNWARLYLVSGKLSVCVAVVERPHITISLPLFCACGSMFLLRLELCGAGVQFCLGCSPDWLCLKLHSFPYPNLVSSERKHVSTQSAYLHWAGRSNFTRPDLLSRQINYLHYSTSRRSMSRFTVKELERRFIKYANSDEFPDTAVEWHEYDGQIRIVFIWVE